MSNDYQQVCPHCGKVIEPGYYAYDQKAHTAWLEQEIAKAEQQAIENFKHRLDMTIRALAKPPRWTLTEPLSGERLEEFKKQRAMPPAHMYPEDFPKPLKAIKILTDEQMKQIEKEIME